ncbi:uncharacterized protein LOC100893658 [Strongylocentrotus purpuratus]|uniref:Secreted protein n=1 Tax=Strongylocentrotus purpuratus TaxID=7668 RepID=A0A7M7NF55_STRPU|nr:uncharacterized protein LOC100893658 [Strongylocentrotus purpuratus]
MMQFTVILFIVMVVLVAILAQLELESEPLIAQRSATLSSDKHETFRMVTDLQGFHKWMTFVVYVAEDLDTSPQVKMGKPFRMYASSPIGKIEIPATITKHQYPSRVEFETKGTMMSVKSNFNIEDGEMAGFSKLTWKIHAKRKSYLYWVTVVQPLKFILSQQVTASLFNLKVLMQ